MSAVQDVEGRNLRHGRLWPAKLAAVWTAAALVVGGLGWAGSRIQTGQLNTYAFAIVVGVLVVLGILLVQ